MPPGFVHFSFFKAGYLIEIPTSIYIGIHNPLAGVSHFLGYNFGRYIEPDWDCVVMNASESRVVNELKLIGYPLFGISSMYGAIFRKKHRSFLTHFPVVSTLIRLIFVFWWIGLLYYYNLIHFDYWQLEAFVYFLWGLSQADLIHYIADKIWDDNGIEYWERKNKKKRRK